MYIQKTISQKQAVKTSIIFGFVDDTVLLVEDVENLKTVYGDSRGNIQKIRDIYLLSMKARRI